MKHRLVPVSQPINSPAGAAAGACVLWRCLNSERCPWQVGIPTSLEGCKGGEE